MDTSDFVDKSEQAEVHAAVALGQRLVETRGVAVQADFARLLGVHKNTLARYESGERHPDSEFLRRLAALDYNIHWLITGRGSRKNLVKDLEPYLIQDQDASRYEAELERGSYVRVSELRTRGGEQASGNCFAFRRSWLEQELKVDPEFLHLICQVGNSMSPEIEHGDWVMVDSRPLQGSFHEGIYLLRISGNFIMRRIQVLRGDEYALKPSNEAYASENVKIRELSGEHDRILGRVVWRSHNLA